MRIWEPKLSWSDCVLLTKKMNEVQEQIVKALSQGKQESGILNDDSMLRVNIIDLEDTIKRLREKVRK